MTFIHVSDVHLGAVPDITKSWANDRSKDVLSTFEKIIKKCNEISADLLLISGDLFNSQPVTNDLNYVNDLFKTIPTTKVCIVAGSNDYIKNNSPILNFRFADNVHYFLNEFPEEYEIEKYNLVVHGFSYHDRNENNALVDSINVKKDTKSHILLAYGGENHKCPIDFNLLANKNFAYCALGSKHTHQDIINHNNCSYPGTPEPLDKNETGEHGILIGEIHINSNRTSSLKFEKICKTMYIPIKIKINGNTSDAELSELVTESVSTNGSENIYSITIYGERDPNLSIETSTFNPKIKISELTDNTEPKYDYIKLSAEHPQDMIGAYIRKMTAIKVELSDVEKKALFYGTNALIKTILE